ncbi:uncharacterized protein [Halyomorpha halys]|uniref:uncharacterized protein isoform X2 n=1 Tax=Halyomorpha halys TaxID=286706 RepID=UPI0034D1B8C2
MPFRQYDICRKPIPPEPSFPVPIIKKPEICDPLPRQPYILPGYSGHMPDWKRTIARSMSRFTHASPTFPFHKGTHILTDCEDYSNNIDFPLQKLREYLQERSLRTKTAITSDYIPRLYEGFVPDWLDKFALQTHMIKTAEMVKLKKRLDKLGESYQVYLEDVLIKPNPFRPFAEAKPFKVSYPLPLLPKTDKLHLPSWTDRPAVRCVPTRPRHCYSKDIVVVLSIINQLKKGELLQPLEKILGMT